MRCQNSDASRYFASRPELSSALGEVGKCHDGIFQQAAKGRLAVTLLLSGARLELACGAL
jgi:hypothetical protein